jgi:hypothetical protein
MSETTIAVVAYTWKLVLGIELPESDVIDAFSFLRT